MPDVFLSYSSADREAAARIVRRLEADGREVFWDQDVPPGTDWDSWIREKLRASRVAVVVWSAKSVKSPNVRHEAMVARDAGKLVPVMIEPLQPDDLPMGLYLVQAVQLSDWRDGSARGYARLAAEIDSRLTGSGPSGTAPERSEAPRPPSRPERTGGRGGLLIGAPIAIGVALVAVWMFTRDPAPDEAAVETPLLPPVCAGGAPPVDGACPPPSANPPTALVVPAPASGFSGRMTGDWVWDAGTACGEGPKVTLSAAGGIVFSRPADPEAFVHAVISDAPEETRTEVISPAHAAGHLYRFTGYLTDDGTDRMRLVVENLTTNSRDVWTPCTLN